jgi:hypothetical protein
VHVLTRALHRAALLVVLISPVEHVTTQGDATVYITKSGTKYHKAQCGLLRSAGLAVKLSELGSQYSACSRCKPPERLLREGQSRKAGSAVTQEQQNATSRDTLKQ